MGDILSTQTNDISTVYKIIENAIGKEEDYIIYPYEDGFFSLCGTRDEGKINVFIIEVVPLTQEEEKKRKKDDLKFDEIYVDTETGKAYVKPPQWKKEAVPFFTITAESEWIYLSYLYSSEKRTGRFNESLICDIGRKIGAEGIYLIDASRGGKCGKKSSLSSQLFVSSSKRLKTYYEELGYQVDGVQSNEDRKENIRYVESSSRYKIKDYIIGLEDFLQKMKEKKEYSNFFYINGLVKFLMETKENDEMTLIDYLDSLIQKEECHIFNAFVEGSVKNFRLWEIKRNYKESEEVIVFFTVLSIIENISFGQYYKRL